MNDKTPHTRPLSALLCAPALALLLGACDGGSDGPTFYDLDSRAIGNGEISPASRRIQEGLSTQFTLSPDDGYRVQTVSGCDGRLTGRVYNIDSVQQNCTVNARFEPVQYRVNTRVEGQGSIQPSGATATIEQTVEFDLEPATDYRLVGVSGCDGELEGATYTVSGPNADCTLTATFEPDVYTVSGTLSAAAHTAVDRTVNDGTSSLLEGPSDNSTTDLAQPLTNRATVTGFASAEASANYCQTGLPERFGQDPNPVDIYRVNLNAGQLIQLEVINHEGHTNLCEEGDSGSERAAGDLDLLLLSANDESQLDSSQGTGRYEELVAPQTGDYFVVVQAESGLSRYLLRLLPEDAESLTDLRHRTGDEFVPGEMLIRYRDRGARSASARRGPAPVHRESIAPMRTASASAPGLARLLRGRPDAARKMDTLLAIKRRRLSPEVEHAEPNFLRRPLRTPNDPGYERQWHYDAINLPDAWALTTGTPDSGEAPVVAVLDTGAVLEHPDLDGRWVTGYDFVSDIDRARDGDGIDPDPSDPGDGGSLTPDSWHGTHVAGTIGAQTDNDEGGAGVSWGARLMPVRVIGADSGSVADILQGVRYAAGLENNSGTLAPTPAKVLNLSLGGEGSSDFERELYEQLAENDMLVVASTGNDGGAQPLYPAAYDSVIGVGATDARGERAHYSNYGEGLDLVAPGGDTSADANGDGRRDGIFSTSAERDAQNNIVPGYSLSYQGTSMAAPHVSGVIALMAAVYPDLDHDLWTDLLTAGELTGQDQRDTELGYGQIDAYLAVRSALRLAQGEDLDLPARVSLEPDRLSLGNTDTGSVELKQEGSQAPDSVSWTSSPGWLSASEDNVDDNGIGRYQLSVDRSGLSEGYHRGRVTFTVDGNRTLTVDVFITEGNVSSDGELALTYVLLVDPEDDNATRFEALALPEGERRETARFEFTDVTPGEYLLVAGSDLDVDGIICQAGEQCGAYPHIEQSSPIRVESSDRTGLDFVVSPLEGASALGTDSDDRADAGYRRQGGAEEENTDTGSSVIRRRR